MTTRLCIQVFAEPVSSALLIDGIGVQMHLRSLKSRKSVIYHHRASFLLCHMSIVITPALYLISCRWDFNSLFFVGRGTHLFLKKKSLFVIRCPVGIRMIESMWWQEFYKRWTVSHWNIWGRWWEMLFFFLKVSPNILNFQLSEC